MAILTQAPLPRGLPRGPPRGARKVRKFSLSL